MLAKRPSLAQVLEICLFIIVIFFAIRPVINYDFWFHAKNGWFIWTTHTLPFKDVFSHTAFGHPAIPYEWLFDAIIYPIYSHLGSVGVQAVVVSATLAYLLIFRQIIKEFFHVPASVRILLIGGLYIIGYDYWVERPQTIAFLCFVSVLYLILKRVLANRNYLFLTPIIMFVWTNLHASMILGLYLLGSFAAMEIIKYVFTREKSYLRGGITLFGYTLICSLVTIFPPLGTKVYQLLWLFWQNRNFITKVISEWVPLSDLAERYYLYMGVILVCVAVYLFAIFKTYRSRKISNFELQISNLLLLLPLVPLGLFVISGVRQTAFSFPALFVLFAASLSAFSIKLPAKIANVLIIIFLIFVAFGLNAYRESTLKFFLPYPSAAIPFIRNNIHGNMFNEYELGGYLMYELGPQQKIFIDGRTDMYLDKVLPEYDFLSDSVQEVHLTTIFSQLTDKYHLSWAILTNQKFTFPSVMGRVLQDDNHWILVYFDDQVFIFVKNDETNADAIKKFSFQAATPLRKQIYVAGKRDLARQEYERMFALSPSSLSATALGYFMLEDKNFDAAKKYFQEALKIKPDSASPKMNLAELSAKDGDFTTAISLYRQAIEDDSQRGLAYLRLGELIISSGGSRSDAIAIWQEGLRSTPDKDIKNKIQQDLANN